MLESLIDCFIYTNLHHLQLKNNIIVSKSNESSHKIKFYFNHHFLLSPLIIKNTKKQNTKYLIASTIRTTKRKILIYNQNKTHKEKIYFRFDVPKTESTLKPIMINNYIKAAEAAKIGIWEINLVNETVYWDSVVKHC
jgi:hypothetical protein